MRFGPSWRRSSIKISDGILGVIPNLINSFDIAIFQYPVVEIVL